MIPIKKIFIDSKARAVGSTSTSNFIIDLPESYTMPEDCAFHIDGVCIPCSWYIVRQNFNDSLVIATKDETLAAPNNVEKYYELTIPEGHYDGDSLASAINNLMPNSGANALYSPYTFSVTFFKPSAKIQISAKLVGATGTKYFKVLTDSEIKTIQKSGAIPTSTIYPFYSLNTILGNTGTTSAQHQHSNPWMSGSIDFNPIKYVLIRSPNFGTFMTVNALHGEKTIVKKVMTNNAKFGDIIADYIRSGEDLLDCSKQTLRRLGFRLSDEGGNDLDLNGHDCSFSIVFSLKAKE